MFFIKWKVKMAGYWPIFFFLQFMDPDDIWAKNKQKRVANIRLSLVSKGCITWQKGHCSSGTKAGNPLSQVANQNAGFVYLSFSAA